MKVSEILRMLNDNGWYLAATGLTKASVANVSQIITVDKTFLTERIGRLNPRLLAEVDDGLRLVLSV